MVMNSCWVGLRLPGRDPKRPDGVSVEGDAPVEACVLEQVQLQRPVVAVEERSSAAEDDGVSAEQLEAFAVGGLLDRALMP
jgi:hypothetical protein